MPDKQDRYRQRKSEQGLRRVEVLTPAELVPHLKAYARALRDTHALGAEPPLFDGMGRTAQILPLPIAPDASSTKKRYEGIKSQNSVTTSPKATSERKNGRGILTRPDFSKGLLEE